MKNQQLLLPFNSVLDTCLSWHNKIEDYCVHERTIYIVPKPEKNSTIEIRLALRQFLKHYNLKFIS